jgi:hypothetical protein
MTCEVIEQPAPILIMAGPINSVHDARRNTMTDANLNASTIASRYIELWNEKAPNRRRDILAADWASNAKYVDPLMSSDGHDGIDAMIAGVQQRFPEFRFTLIGTPNGYGDHVRFSWGLGPEGIDSPIKGTDFAVVRDGRIQSITGFLDQIPQSV